MSHNKTALLWVAGLAIGFLAWKQYKTNRPIPDSVNTGSTGGVER